MKNKLMRKESRIPIDALRWTTEITPDIPPPTKFGVLTKGFLQNAYSLRIEPACSSSVSHAFGRDDKTTTQGPVSIFSTKLLALKAMRFEVEMECASKLHEIDKKIELETGAETAKRKAK